MDVRQFGTVGRGLQRFPGPDRHNRAMMTRPKLPHVQIGHLVGAGSGVYNTSRQVGAVIGAAAVGAMMQINLQFTGFSAAMGLSLVLHVVVLTIGFFAVSRFRSDLPPSSQTT